MANITRRFAPPTTPDLEPIIPLLRAPAIITSTEARKETEKNLLELQDILDVLDVGRKEKKDGTV